MSCSVEGGAVSRSRQTLLRANVADIRVFSTFVENGQPLTQHSLAYAYERHLVWAGAIGAVTHSQQCKAFTSSPGLEGDRDGAAGIRGKARPTAGTYYSEGAGVETSDTLAQGDTGRLIVRDRHPPRRGLLADGFDAEPLKGWPNEQRDELEGADVAEIVAVAEARDTALVDLAQARRRRVSADGIIAAVDRSAAILQGDGLGRSAVELETVRIQLRIYVEDVAAIVGDHRACGLANQRMRRCD